MRSSSALFVVASLWTASSHAQPAAGFALERFAASAPGAGWLTADELRLSGGLGGAASASAGYANRPLELAGARVVSDQAFVELAGAVTWSRFRLSLHLASPLVVRGASAEVGGYAFSAPRVSVESNPDTLSDVRVGLAARLFGERDGPLRLGVGVELLIPSGTREEYLTDGTFRGVVRLLGAGDAGPLSWAAELGVHLRPLDEPFPSGPHGSELLFGVAAGVRRPLRDSSFAVIVGPELSGQSALRALFARGSTGVEALLGVRLEETRGDARLRLKLGVGSALVPGFGTPAWRIVLGFELSGSTGSR